MAIRESLLNTITSVASSDFVRLVTSAGESSKATVANLFKSFESGLGSKSSLTTSDYIRVVGSDNVSYKQLVSSVMTAMGLDAIKSPAKTVSNIDTATATGFYGYTSTASGTLPVSGSGGDLIVIAHSETYSIQVAIPYSTTNASSIFKRVIVSGTPTSWERQPTRTEMDAFNNHGTKIGTITGTSGANMRDTPGGTLVKQVPGDSKVFVIGGITNSAYKCLYLETSSGTWYQGYIVTQYITIE